MTKQQRREAARLRNEAALAAKDAERSTQPGGYATYERILELQKVLRTVVQKFEEKYGWPKKMNLDEWEIFSNKLPSTIRDEVTKEIETAIASSGFTGDEYNTNAPKIYEMLKRKMAENKDKVVVIKSGGRIAIGNDLEEANEQGFSIRAVDGFYNKNGKLDARRFSDEVYALCDGEGFWFLGDFTEMEVIFKSCQKMPLDTLTNQTRHFH
jgi:hypothetical protein